MDAQAHLRVALDNMPGALVYTDDDLRIVVCNNRFKEMYTVPQELLQPGRPYPDFLRYLAENGYYGPGDAALLVAQRVESLRNPSGKSFEDHAPDGRWYRILRHRVPAGCTVTVMTDVTEQELAERELLDATRRTEEANKLITEKNRTLEALNSEIQDKNRQVQEQAEQIAQWNARLESRVAEQVAQIGKMSKLTRFLSPKVPSCAMISRPSSAWYSRSTLITSSGSAVSVKAVKPRRSTNTTVISRRRVLSGSSASPAMIMSLTIGTIGFEGRLDYGAIGTVTNLAARLCGEAGDGQILISPRTFSKTETQIEAGTVGELSLKGFQRPVLAHNVLRLRSPSASP